MNYLLKLLAANLACIFLLLFTIWALNNEHPNYAFVAFLVALAAAKTIKND